MQLEDLWYLHTLRQQTIRNDVVGGTLRAAMQGISRMCNSKTKEIDAKGKQWPEGWGITLKGKNNNVNG
jgi:hypothetical protein